MKTPMKWNVTLLGGALLLWGVDLKATTTFSELEADVYLSCGGNEMCEAWELSMGDFDGDGFEDLLFPLHDFGVTGPDFVVFGDRFPAGGSVPVFRTTKIGSVVIVGFPNTQIGDITGDGKAEIFHFRGSGAICDVTLGRSNPPAFISSPGDFAISGASVSGGDAIAFGDVNGDGLKDLLFYQGTAYVVFGSTSFNTFTSTISLTEPARVMRILGGGYGGLIVSGDVDGDGYDDIVFNDPKSGSGGARTQPGVVYVIRGSTSLPSEWDLATRSADWTIYGAGVEYLSVNFTADFTGDGKADLGLKINRVSILDNEPVLLSGADLLSKGPICVLTPGQANSLTPTSFSVFDHNSNWMLPRDFDGDGRPDLCAKKKIFLSLGFENEEIYLFLSHSFPAGSALPEMYPPADIRFTDLGTKLTMGDLNGDGKSDLVYISESFPRLNVFYGFRPLKNPSMVVQPRESNQARVHLTLSVEGEPAEMKLTGNILDPAPGVWVPFQSKVDATLTPEVGEKTITAVFRTSGKRESSSVSATVPLELGEAGASVVTNLLRNGGTARVESRLDTAGRLTAMVYTRKGKLLRNIVDEEMSIGAHVIEWDGRNSAGELVSPGMYVLVVTVNGHSEIHKIIVQG